MALSWVGPDAGNTDFNHAGNWNPAQVPTASDDLTVSGYAGVIHLQANGAGARTSIRNSAVDMPLNAHTLNLGYLLVNEPQDNGAASLSFTGPGTVSVEQPGIPVGAIEVGRGGMTGELRIDGVDAVVAEGGVYLGLLPATDEEGQPLEVNSDGRLIVLDSSLVGSALSVGDSTGTKGTATFEDSFLDLRAALQAIPPAIPGHFPPLPAGIGLGPLNIAKGGIGTATFTTSEGLLGRVTVGLNAHGVLTVEGGTYYGYSLFEVGVGDQGDATLKSAAKVYVLDLSHVGSQNDGVGIVTVENLGTLLELAGFEIGGAGTGTLKVQDSASVKARPGAGSIVGATGTGNVQVFTKGTVETNDVVIAQNAGATANVEVVGDGSKWDVNGNVTSGGGNRRIDVRDKGQLNARNIALAVNEGNQDELNVLTQGLVSASEGIEIGRHSVLVTQSGTMQAVEEILIGASGAYTDVEVSLNGQMTASADIIFGNAGGIVDLGVLSNGLVSTTDDVLLHGGTTVYGDSTIAADTSVQSFGSTITPGADEAVSRR